MPCSGSDPGRRARRVRRILLAATLVAAGGVVALGIIHERVRRCAEQRVFTPASAPARRVAVVFGARVFSDGDVSWPLEERLETALALYKNGKTRKLLVSGDNGRTEYNEPETMRDWLIARGVSPDDVACDYAGFRTLDTCARASRLWQIREVLLVTQRYHLPRALFLADAWGLDAVGVAPAPGRRPCRRDQAREVAARIVAWLDVNLWRRQPRFFGPKETI